MTVVIARRSDIDLDSFVRAAWEGEDVAVAADALAEVARRREQLLAFVAANPGRKLYGVNVHAGDGSNRVSTTTSAGSIPAPRSESRCRCGSCAGSSSPG
jgi:histidine ammonia-lyase